MQITIPQSAFARELSLVSGVAEKKTTIPILANVLLCAGEEGVTLTATNLEQGITSHVECTVREPGRITVPAKRLQMLVGALSGDITLRTDDKHYLTVTAGRSRTRIAGMGSESFPELPTGGEFAADLDAKLFARHLASVGCSISRTQSNYATQGALVEIAPESLRAVATDGNRLSFAEVKAKGGSESVSLLFPRAAISRFASIADSLEEGARVAISQDDNHIFLSVGAHILITRKMAGRFPDYGRILPSYSEYSSLSRDEFKAALTRAVQYGSGDAKRVEFNFGEGELTLTAMSPTEGESTETVGCDGPIRGAMGFAAQSILEAISGFSHPRVAAFLGKGPCEFRPMAGAGTDQDPYRVTSDVRFVLMPLAGR